jgi:hypothetical protein
MLKWLGFHSPETTGQWKRQKRVPKLQKSVTSAIKVPWEVSCRYSFLLGEVGREQIRLPPLRPGKHGKGGNHVTSVPPPALAPTSGEQLPSRDRSASSLCNPNLSWQIIQQAWGRELSSHHGPHLAMQGRQEKAPVTREEGTFQVTVRHLTGRSRWPAGKMI